MPGVTHINTLSNDDTQLPFIHFVLQGGQVKQTLPSKGYAILIKPVTDQVGGIFRYILIILRHEGLSLLQLNNGPCRPPNPGKISPQAISYVVGVYIAVGSAASRRIAGAMFYIQVFHQVMYGSTPLRLSLDLV